MSPTLAERIGPVVTLVVLRENQTLDANKLRELLRERDLPGWKSPREIIAIDELPRSPTGKILWRELANWWNGAVHPVAGRGDEPICSAARRAAGDGDEMDRRKSTC